MTSSRHPRGCHRTASTPWRSFPGFNPEDECPLGAIADPPGRGFDAGRNQARRRSRYVAKEAGLSRAHFFRLFESSIGLPPKVYLNLIRMEQAVDAVLNQSASVCETSNQLGFTEPAHFTRFFP